MVTLFSRTNKNTTNNEECQKEVSHLDIIKLNEQEELSSETDSISLSTDDDEREVIQLQYDEDEYEDEYYVPGIDNKPPLPEEEEDEDDDPFIPGYKRMNLRGESESDKDLIIYSLNESLQIHKEIVERIQGEKDDLEHKHDLQKQEEQKEFELEKSQAETEELQSKEKITKLEAMYQALVKELEAKKLDYRRMETRFHSHIKDIRSKDDSLNTIKSQIQQLLTQISELCEPLSTTATANTLDYFFERWPDMMNHYFENEELDTTAISLLTEKMLWESIMHDILQTAIHPGVSLNSAFGKIYNWVEKRNTSWASRMRQQITAFVVKQSNEQDDTIEQQRKSIIHDNWERLCTMYNITAKDQKTSLKKKWSKIVDLAVDLNIGMKCQDNPPIEILKIQEGTLYDKNTMKSWGDGDIIAFIVSPPFVATPLVSAEEEEAFLIPAKVYCF